MIEIKTNVCQLIQKSAVLDCIDTTSIKSFLYVSVRPPLYFSNRLKKIQYFPSKNNNNNTNSLFTDASKTDFFF